MTSHRHKRQKHAATRPPTSTSKLSALVLVAGCAAALVGCKPIAAPAARASAAAAAPALSVTTAVLVQRPLATSILASGSVVAWELLAVSAAASGVAITEIAVDEGETVAAGQVLARLDATILSAELAQREAAVERARAMVLQRESAVREAEATASDTYASWQRAVALAERGNASRQQLDERQTASRTAVARLEAAREGVKVARAELVLSAAERDQVKARLLQTEIRAPAAGYVAKRTASLGQVVAPGTALFEIVRDGRLELDAEIPEASLAAIRGGAPARVRQVSGETVLGIVRSIGPTVDPATRLGKIRIALPPLTPLLPGMFASAEIETGHANVLALPEAAVISNAAASHVFAIRDDGSAALRAVETGARHGGWIEVRAGLEPTARVVLSGARLIRDGDLVHVVEPSLAMRAEEG